MLEQCSKPLPYDVSCIDAPSYNETKIWKAQLKASRITLKELDTRGILPAEWREGLKHTFNHPLAISERLLQLMDKGNPNCPIVRQYIPQSSELIDGGLKDPIGDDVHSVKPGLIHRYKNRVLVLTNAVCPVYCRYCFRKNSMHEDGTSLSQEKIQAVAEYVESNSNIDEIILSGGDPLILNDEVIERLLTRFSSITHLRTIRFHTKTIIAIPSRVTKRLLNLFQQCKKNIVVVHHTNHPAELGNDVLLASKALSAAGVLQLNQSVLLKSVNDNPETIIQLSKKLVDFSILPYYLSITDDVKGAQHFKVSIEDSRKIYRIACQALSGYERPRLILDLPEAIGKVNAEASRIRVDEDGRVSYFNEGEWSVSGRDRLIMATMVD